MRLKPVELVVTGRSAIHARPHGQTKNTMDLKYLKDQNYGTPPESQSEVLQNIAKPHVDSFNYMIDQGLQNAVQNISPVEFSLPSGQRVLFSISNASILKPQVSPKNMHATSRLVYPAECRERGTTYKGQLSIALQWGTDGVATDRIEAPLGDIPIMVKSKLCNLHGMKPKALVAHGEEPEEMGGYFIINGNEKLIRMIVNPRRNYPTALNRPSWKNRGASYTEYGITMRCVASDQSAATIVLHYLNTGSCNLSFTYMKEQFFVPVVIILKALMDVPDQYIFEELCRGREEDSFYKGCVTNMLRLARSEGLASQASVLKYVGERFRIKLHLPEWYTDKQVAEFLLKKCVCIHVKNNRDKFNTLIYMTKKLYTFAKGGCSVETHDNPMFQEALLGGHLYLMFLKERLESWLQSLKSAILKKAKEKGPDFVLNNAAVNYAMRFTMNITHSVSYMLATGNLVSTSGLGLMQATGMCVIADKLNFMRYLSHFRAIHRGAFFSEMRTTAVRKLLPEAWGFICPVHTPDGAPCGLLNHLSGLCQIVNTIYPNSHIPKILSSLGMSAITDDPPGGASECYQVMLEGRLIGWLPDADAPGVVSKLRQMKVLGEEKMPPVCEICFVPKRRVEAQYPGLYLFTSPARLMRPVHNLALDKTEMVGSFEQIYLEICVCAEEAIAGLTTHMELHPEVMLSVLGSLTPYSNYNQSPRNIYQCQMGKQTMGTPLHAYKHRADNKLYRLQTPQSPMVRTQWYDHYNIDEYPLGTNAIVAVISYTGYDMEDAMIINRGSYDRGFGHGSIYKSEFVDLADISKRLGRATLVFGSYRATQDLADHIDSDGLPFIGSYLEQGTPYYSVINVNTGDEKIFRYKANEPAWVEQVKVLGDDNGTEELRRICIVLRVERNPIIGDKFASRHGQKGICSQKWPTADMPFSETGMMPDIIFNPHGFPSRMTIGMMIESMAGKSAAVHGLCHDATPFTYTEEKPPIDYFGRMLTAAGYNYYGTERIYSGIDGREMEADIFFGIVYYQRLRHMVSDKFQVRTTGPIDNMTHQPVKGRKRAGGIRFGEMERDSLLSHGTSFLLEDRLLNCSDKTLTHVCIKCGSILSPYVEAVNKHGAVSAESLSAWTCLICRRADTVKVISIPYVFRYLTAELAAMNIKMKLEIKDIVGSPTVT